MTDIISQIPKDKISGYVDALPDFSGADDSELQDYAMVPVSRPPTEVVPLVTGADDEELESDFQLVRQNLNEVVSKTAEAVQDVLELARATESPRAYEVLATTIKTLMDANKELLEVHAKKASIKEKAGKNTSSAPTTINNTQQNVFVGSSTDILDIINKSRGIQ